MRPAFCRRIADEQPGGMCYEAIETKTFTHHNYFSGNIYGGPITLNSYDLINGVFGGGGYITPTSGTGNANFSGLLVGVNDRSTAGVNGNGGTAANAAAADAVKTGFEFGIPLSLLGNPTGNLLRPNCNHAIKSRVFGGSKLGSRLSADQSDVKMGTE